LAVTGEGAEMNHLTLVDQHSAQGVLAFDALVFAKAERGFAQHGKLLQGRQELLDLGGGGHTALHKWLKPLPPTRRG